MFTRALKVLATIVLLFAVNTQAPVASAEDRQLQKVRFRMDFVPTGIYAAFYYAQQRGFYAREGLDVDVLPGQGTLVAMDEILRGDLDFGFASCWGMAIGVGKGRDIVSLATFTGKNGYAFFYPKASDVKSLKDLSGKTIVVSSAGLDMSFYTAVLAINGMAADSLKRVVVDPAQKIATYTRGQADTVSTHYAASSPAIDKLRPSSYLTWYSMGFVVPDFCIFTSREKLAKNPALAEKFLRASFAAAEDAAKKPDDAAAAAVELNPLLDRARTRREWELMTELFYSDDTKGCPHGWHSPSDWSKGLDILKKYANLEGAIDDHAKFYTNQFFSCKR